MAMDMDKITKEMNNLSMKPEIMLKLKDYKKWVVKSLPTERLDDNMARSIFNTRVKWEMKGYIVKHHKDVASFMKNYFKSNRWIPPPSSDEESETDTDDGEDTVMKLI